MKWLLLAGRWWLAAWCLISVAGGVPVKVGNAVISAVGMGGAPVGHLDEQCAMAALDKVKDALK